MYNLLTSRDNPRIKELARLIRQKKRRDTQNLFVIEGVRLAGEAADSNLEITQVFATDDIVKREPELVKKLSKMAKDTWQITNMIAHGVADTKNPQGLFAVCRKPSPLTLDQVLTKNGHYIILDNLQDPGNVGTILRTALAMGIDGVFVSDDTAEIYSPKVLRGAMGAVFNLPIVICKNLDYTIQEVQKAGLKVYATALTDDAQPIKSSLFSNGGGVLLGNEGAGLSDERIALCDGTVIIPMSQKAESLNVGIAAGITMWEMTEGER